MKQKRKSNSSSEGGASTKPGSQVPSVPTEGEVFPCPIVALGASAGGLDALRQLFAHVPAKTGMSFVLIQHLDPDRSSMLSQVIKGITGMSVTEAKSGSSLDPDCVYVIPSSSDLIMQDGTLMLVPRQKTGRLHLPIDTFFRSLAEDARGRAIGVVLSGSGADGTEGLRAIRAEGGITIAQSPESAQFPSMPSSAIAAETVDFSGTPAEIAAELVRLSQHPYVADDYRAEQEPQEPAEQPEKNLDLIFGTLRQQASVDFSGYKRTTVMRRIERRMALRRSTSLADYAADVNGNAAEARALAQDMLIHVTSFFRDPGSFDALKSQVFEVLARQKEPGDPIRIWAPGCATGEEAYTIIMCLLEALDGIDHNFQIKLFGTDLSEQAVETARHGIYSDSVVADLSPERLKRFFERVDNGYRISTQVRDLCAFVRHDLTRDPPFAKLDVISCRNVLIYFDAELQRRVIPLLHYCLNPHGFLLLGQSETITGFRDLFAPVDREHRIFGKTGDSMRLVHPLISERETEVRHVEIRPPERRQHLREAQRQADHLLLARYSPAGVIINDKLEVIQFRGRTGAYLEPAPGQPQANLLRMARGGLVAHLHDAIEKAKSTGTAVRKSGLRVQLGTEIQNVDIEAVPIAAIPGSSESYFLVLFAEAGTLSMQLDRSSARPRDWDESGEDAATEGERMHAELVATKDLLQSLISEHQSTTDELAAANEEFVAANEELQSTNEELQSAKEELQSTNEELSTVNDQLRSRNMELDLIANDMVNVLSSVEIPVIIVDLELRVRRFTPTVRNISSFIPEDIGRPIDDLKLKVRIDDLPARIAEVIAAMAPKEWEVQSHDGRWLRLQIRPYRTSDDRMDGAVLSFIDVDQLKRAIEDAQTARDYARGIVETVTAALVVLDGDLRVVSANEALCDMFGLSGSDPKGKVLREIGGQPWQAPELRHALDEVLQHHVGFKALELVADRPHGGKGVFAFTGRPILWGGDTHLVLLTIDDVTELRSIEAERAQLLDSEKQARLDAERATRAKDFFLATLSHELRTPLSTMLMSAQLLRQIKTDDTRIERASATIERAATSQARLIDDLLDVSRIVSGKLMLELGPVDFVDVVREAVDLARPAALAKHLDLKLSVDGNFSAVYGDPSRLQQVVNNLLANAIKFTPRAGSVSVSLICTEGHARLTVQDTGMGIRAEVLPQLFSRFVQADSSVTRTHGGLGLGLSIVRHLVDVHGGEVHASSAGEGLGATFVVTLPLGAADMADAPVAVRAVARSIGGIRILLVEDDNDTREVYSAMLSELGANVQAVASVSAALIVLDHFTPQVILSDIAMPGEDGFALIRRVRERTAASGGLIPAAALTALASDEDRKHAISAGFQMHVAKPLDAARLASVVSTLIDWKPLDNAPVDTVPAL